MASAMVTPVLEVRGLEKRLESGDVLADVRFALYPGDVLGIVGPGAGKSILMRVLAGLLPADGGEIWVDGTPLRQETSARLRLAYCGGACELFPETTLRGYLRWFARAQGIDDVYVDARVDEVLAITRLAPLADDRMTTLKRGELRRAGLARSLVHAPRVLLLDDPLSGLQRGESDLWVEMLEQVRVQGCGIVIAAETMRDVRHLLTHACVLAAGRVLACDRVDALDGRVAQLRCVTLLVVSAERAMAILEASPGVFRATRLGDIIKLLFMGDSDEVLALVTQLTARGSPVVSFREEAAYLM